jgi:hypothetical protein
MNEYFVVSNSFAAPFFSDTDTGFVKGSSPKDAMDRFRKSYKHPCGLYAANLFQTSDSYHKRTEPLLKWSSQEAKKAAAEH